MEQSTTVTRQHPLSRSNSPVSPNAMMLILPGTPSESEPQSSPASAPSLHAPVTISFPDMEITIQLQPGEEQSLKPASMDSLLQRLSEHIKARSSPVPAAPKRVMVPLSHEENEFRKGSVAMGHVSTQFINPISSVKHMIAAERENVGNEQMNLIVESYLNMVAGSDNLATASSKWYDMFMPENVFFKRFLMVLAEQIVKPLKMSRWGAGLRILGILLLQYQDMVSDILVMKQFYEEKQVSTGN